MIDKYNIIRKKLDVQHVLDLLDLDFHQNRNELFFLCPVHDDKNPSCSINIDKQSLMFLVVSCFGCDFSGTLVTLVSKVLKKSEDSAKNWLIRLVKPEEAEEDVETILLNETVDFTHKFEKKDGKLDEVVLPDAFNLINTSKRNSYFEYLTGRGLTEKEIKEYGWGYCAKGFYKKRVVMPVFMENRMATFFTRHIFTDNDDKKVFNAYRSTTSKIVFPFNEIDFDLKYVWVTESVFNFFSLRKEGLKNLVCLFGNKMTPWKVRFFEKFDVMNMVPDGDEGGREWMQKASQLIAGVDFFAVKMIEGEDANSVGRLELKQVLTTLSSFILQKSDNISTDFSVKPQA